MNTLKLAQQVSYLPEELQLQVFHFVAFLIWEYKIDIPEILDTKMDLSKEEKDLLDERSRLFRENREKAIPLKQVMENIKEKYQIQ